MTDLNTIPIVSVIVPTYNGDVAKMELTFDSIKKQSFPNFECIVVDDSDKVDVIKFLESVSENDTRFFYCRGQGVGIAAALNIGIGKSRGDFIARVDDTDILNLTRFEIQLAYLKKHKEVSVVGSYSLVQRGENSFIRRYPESHNKIRKGFLFSCPIAHSAVMARKTVLVAAGGYDETFSYCEDLELWLRLLRSGVQFGNCKTDLILFDSKVVIRSNAHFKSNSRARLKHSADILIGISYFISLLHFVIPAGARSVIKRFFER